MTGLIKGIAGRFGSTTLLTLGIAAGLASLVPTAARAADDGRYGDRYGRDYRYGDERRYERVYHDRHDHYRDRDKSEIKVDVDFSTGRTSIRRETELRSRYHERRVRYWVEPTYRTVSERVWVEPVHRTVTERVWVEPVYRTIHEEVAVPARYEVREVVRYQRGRKVVIRERILVDPACTRRIARNVCVREGRWDVIEKQVCVSEGHWDIVERQMCVTEGRWDYCVERVEVTGREEQTLLDVRL